MLTIPTTPFQWQSWDCFTLVNYIRTQHNLPAIDAQWVYDRYPTQDSFHKKSLLSIVPKLGTQQQGIFPLNILLIESENGEFCLGTAIADDTNTNTNASNKYLWCALMGYDHAHCIPLSRLSIATITAWLPNAS